jgi:hypothetical protein
MTTAKSANKFAPTLLILCDQTARCFSLSVRTLERPLRHYNAERCNDEKERRAGNQVVLDFVRQRPSS